jgi:hypothetical protein
MEVKPCGKPDYLIIGALQIGMGVAGVMAGYLPLAVLIPCGAMVTYPAISHAHITKAKPEELVNLKEVSANFICSCCGEESTFVQKIRRLSYLQVERIKGKISNIRKVKGWFSEKTIADLVGDSGVSIPCELPKDCTATQGEKVTLDAVLTKVNVNGSYQTGLKAYEVLY